MQSLLNTYNPAWPQQFVQIRTIVGEALKHLKVDIHHVGSTAVPNLASKPVIDVDIVYPFSDQFIAIKKGLQSIGYRHVGDQGIKGREVFKRRGCNRAVLNHIAHHLYVNAAGSLEWRRHVAFRDYLIKHAAARDEYQQLKIRIAKAAAEDRKLYAQLKETKAAAFIENILSKCNLRATDFND